MGVSLGELYDKARGTEFGDQFPAFRVCDRLVDHGALHAVCDGVFDRGLRGQDPDPTNTVDLIWGEAVLA